MGTRSGLSAKEEIEDCLCAIGEEIEDCKAISLEEVMAETEKDATLQAVLRALGSGDWSKEESVLKNFMACKEELGEVKGIVVRDDRIIPPSSLHQRILQIVHRGHPGVVMMKRTIREKLWWPGIDKMAEEFAKSCMGCVAMSKADPPEPMCRSEMPERPWQSLGIDYLEIPECGTEFLVVVDYYSRYLEVRAVREANASNTIKALADIFNQWAFPEKLRLDNGQPFASREFAEYAKSKNIQLEFAIPYWPQMNGAVERQNKGVVRALRIRKVEQKKWAEVMKDYVYAYNIRPSSVTNKAPLEVMTGRMVKDLLPSLKFSRHSDDGEIREKDRLNKGKGKAYGDKTRHAKTSEIAVGDEVFVVNKKLGKLQPKFTPIPFKVISKEGNETIIQSKEGVKYRRCVADLKKWLAKESDGSPVPEGRDKAPASELRQPPPTLRPRQDIKKPERFQAIKESSETMIGLEETEEGNVGS